jgi:hypothetical protein
MLHYDQEINILVKPSDCTFTVFCSYNLFLHCDSRNLYDRNILTTNGKELRQTLDKICAEYLNAHLRKGNRTQKDKRNCILHRRYVVILGHTV